jgi:spore coat protein A
MKRFLLLTLILLTAGAIVAMGTPASAQFAQSPQLQKFAQPLRNLQVFDPNGIPVAVADGTRKWPGVTATHYTIDIGQFQDQLHPDLGPTTLWGFGQNFINNTNWTKHLGGVIVAQKGQPIQITFRNRLTDTGAPGGIPLPNIIPVDTTIPGAEQAQNRTAVHAHGGYVPWISDGGPFDWWAPNGIHGPSFLNNQVLRPGQNVPSNEAEYYYPNQQSARFIWYHDHAYGITRINAYAGIASAYVITDSYEAQLVAQNKLPGPVDPRTLYLVFQDKIFVNTSTATQDPTWNSVTPTASQGLGSLWYAHFYDPGRWTLGPHPAGLPPNPSVIPEFFGDTILVNGTVFPIVTLQQRQYRLRMLNACNARFLNPRLIQANGNTWPDSAEPLNNNYTNPPVAAGFIQIGSEGGFLPYPVYLNLQGQQQLLMAPAERADLIVDLRNVPVGTYLLYNDASAPYPGGDDANDYYTGNTLNTASGAAGFGPNTRTLLQIVVTARTGPADPAITLPNVFTPTDPFLLDQKPSVPSPIPGPTDNSMRLTVSPGKKNAKVNVRHLTLNEDFDQYGRLIQKLGTNATTSPGQFGLDYTATPTEITNEGDYEVWEIANLTGDTHPIHFHLVNVQVLARAPFSSTTYSGVAYPTADPLAPDFNELGWKETVRMNPSEVTWVLMKFDLPKVPFKVPSSPRIDAYGMTPNGKIANEYVWHCHILEHEEHDMMRPLVVFSPKGY